MSLLRWTTAGLVAAFELCSSAPSLSMPAKDLFCEGHTDCRPLTTREVRYAKTIFGNKIDYGVVRVVNKPSSFFARYAAATAHGSNIHYHEAKLLSDDHARESLLNRKLLVHELTHVWQAQNGIDVRALGLALLLRYPMNYNAAYKYDIGKPFAAYNMEQQAKIVEHYAIAREAYGELESSYSSSTGQKRREAKAHLERVCKTIGARYEILTPYFPLSPHPCNHATP